MNNAYIPAQPEMARMKMSYVPCQNGSVSNKFNYIPCSTSIALGPNGITNDKRQFTSFKLSWWEPESFFQYPCILVSAYYGMKWNKDFRTFFNIPDDFIIIGDSGGFQNMTQEAKLNPLEVLRWQEANCQIGLTFDLPIFKDDTTTIKREKQIGTVDNAYEALNSRQNKDLKLYAVIQGHTPEEQQFIFDEYKKKGDLTKFDGYAIGGLVPISGDMSMLTNVLLTFLENVKQYNKPVHFFGLSGNNIMPIIFWMKRKYNMQITFDSSSYGSGAIRKEYWIDNGSMDISFGNENPTMITRLPCDCPICKVCNVDAFKASGSISGGLIALHNLYMTIKYVNEIECISEDESLFMEYVKKFCKPEVTIQIEKVNYVLKEGFEKATQKYSMIQKVENKKTMNLFGFS